MTHPNAEAVYNDLIQQFEADPGQFEKIDLRTQAAAVSSCGSVHSSNELIKDIMEREVEHQLSRDDEPEYDVLNICKYPDSDSIIMCMYSIKNNQNKILLLAVLDTTYPITSGQHNYRNRQKDIINDSISEVLKEQYEILRTENLQLKHLYQVQANEIADLNLQHQEKDATINDLELRHQQKDDTINGLRNELAITQTRLQERRHQQPRSLFSSMVADGQGNRLEKVVDDTNTTFHFRSAPNLNLSPDDTGIRYDGGGRRTARRAPPSPDDFDHRYHVDGGAYAQEPYDGRFHTATTGTRGTRRTAPHTAPRPRRSTTTHYYDGTVPETPLDGRSSRHQGPSQGSRQPYQGRSQASHQHQWDSPDAHADHHDAAESIDPMPPQEPTIPSHVDVDDNGGSDARYHYASRNYASRGAGARDSDIPYMERID